MQDKNKRNTSEIHDGNSTFWLAGEIQLSPLIGSRRQVQGHFANALHTGKFFSVFLYFCIFRVSLFKATFLFLGRCFCIFVLLYLYCQIQFLSICCIFVSSLRPCYHCRCRLSLESCQFLFWPKFLFFIICSVFHFSSKMGRQSLINLIPN